MLLGAEGEQAARAGRLVVAPFALGLGEAAVVKVGPRLAQVPLGLLPTLFRGSAGPVGSRAGLVSGRAVGLGLDAEPAFHLQPPDYQPESDGRAEEDRRQQRGH